MLKPLHDNVIVKRTKAETALPSGIVLPGKYKSTAPQGEVLAIGPGTYDHHGAFHFVSVAIGETVVFKASAWEPVIIGPDEYLVVSEKDILAVVAP